MAAKKKSPEILEVQEEPHELPPVFTDEVQEEPHELPPVFTDEARENRCISLAYDLVEQRLMDGSASAQETVHFLKLGSMKERRELLMLEKQIELTEAKTKNLHSMQNIEELYKNAIAAFRSYQGHADEDVVIFNE